MRNINVDYSALSELHGYLRAFTRGDAPHVVRRLPLAFIFCAFGAPACSAPLALQFFIFCAASLSYFASLTLASCRGVYAYLTESAIAKQIDAEGKISSIWGWGRVPVRRARTNCSTSRYAPLRRSSGSFSLARASMTSRFSFQHSSVRCGPAPAVMRARNFSTKN